MEEMMKTQATLCAGHEELENRHSRARYPRRVLVATVLGDLHLTLLLFRDPCRYAATVAMPLSHHLGNALTVRCHSVYFVNFATF